MITDFYIQRMLQVNGERVDEDTLISKLGIAVVLAEPGAGKSALLKSLANKLDETPTPANLFRHMTEHDKVDVLIIDALDEIVRIDQSAFDAIVVKAQQSGAKKLIFASRSGQWEKARTKAIKNCFDEEPIIVRLKSLSLDEQRSLFEAYKPEEDFLKFQEAVNSADLSLLLGNPQFLKLFSDAYVSRGEKFESKSQAFKDAIEQLATESNEDVSQRDRLPITKIVSLSNELFAKLLLSGATGVSTVDRINDQDFPFINSLIDYKNNDVETLLSTGLFKPTENSNNHEPIHRVIAEFSAARYLTKRISDQSDLLSLKRCLALIAPNSVVRGELRGLLGWMAAVGETDIQKRVIELDPYAILANGDPSQLAESSKKILLEQLGKLAIKNPYFRGEDIWRDFSSPGFFTVDTVDKVKSLLSESSEATHLPSLILELLRGSPAVPHLAEFLHELLLDLKRSEMTRHAALMNLIDIDQHDHIANFNTLLNERDLVSTELAAEIVINFKIGSKISRMDVLQLLNSIIDIHYAEDQRDYKFRRSRFFIQRLIESFNLMDVTWFLDQLSKDFKCICEAENHYDCKCREGKSCIIGRLLDRFFEISNEIPSAQQIWGWCESLNFDRFKNSQDSYSVKVFQENHSLRQQIHRLAFENFTSEDDVREMQFALSFRGGHSGLSILPPYDIQAILDHAFETDNVTLWSSFMPYHQYSSGEKAAQPLRAHARKQANCKTKFGRKWAQNNRRYKHLNREEILYLKKNNRLKKRHALQQQKTIESDQKHFDENYTLIEQGQHWGWLKTFAHGYLTNEKEQYPVMDDDGLPERALMNCFKFLSDHVPTLSQLAHGKGNTDVVYVLFAACLVHFRVEGNLDAIDHHVLKVVKTESDVCYFENHSTDIDEFNNEIDRHIFKTQEDVEQFLRDYFEPQLEERNIICKNLGWLNHRETFSFLRKKLPIEWLERFPNLTFDEENTFFDLAAAHGDLIRLRALINLRCSGVENIPDNEDKSAEFDRRRNFWFLRRFIFEEEISDGLRQWLCEDKNRIFVFSDKFGFLLRKESNGWPDLSAEKIHFILSNFVSQWPKVDLPNSHGNDDPAEEIAYRFLKEIVWRIEKDKPENCIPVLDLILIDDDLYDFHKVAKVIHYSASKKFTLQNFRAPSPESIVKMLDKLTIASVEDLRSFLIEELKKVELWAHGSEFDGLSYFYDNVEHVEENKATKRIANQLNLQCEAKNLSLTIEHHVANNNRCDITIKSNIDSIEKLLVVEVKGQWHRDLYTAASEQLHERYSIHPNAEGQGIYLVLWFGVNEKIANIKNHGINTAEELKMKIISMMPSELHPFIDVLVLDLSK